MFCDKCGFIFWKNPKPTTSIILEKEGKVLLIKRSKEPFKNYWVLPGGYVEYDEDPRSTIEREVKEETGLEVAVDEVVSVYLIDTDPRGNSIDIVYKGSILGGQLNLEEHSQYRFFPPKDLPDLMAYKHRDVIVQYNRG
ncbi:NUDIX hydrolase [Candidatus Gottesmanbacteria bacterium]|nr:NUDIX hydrolase [Candidatus Gottesmanbacteria bacterium]